jgi:hypothetical protein
MAVSGAAASVASEVIVTQFTRQAIPKGMSMAKIAFASFALGGVGALLIGAAVGMLLSVIIEAILEPPPRTADDIYAAIKGMIQTQIDNTLSERNAAGIAARIKTLDEKIFNSTNSLKIASQSRSRSSVENQLLSITNKIDAAESWQISPQGRSVFTLCSPDGMGYSRCLSLKGRYVVAEKDTDMSSLSNKRFMLGEKNRLYALTENGKECIVLDQDAGRYSLSGWAIHQPSKEECEKNPYKLMVDTSVKGAWTLYVGDHSNSKVRVDLCVAEPTDKGEVVYPSNLPNTFKYSACINKQKTLTFRVMNTLPVAENAGTTGILGIEAISFPELAVQMTYFPRIAAMHLLTLKQLYWNRYEDLAVATQFDETRARYARWIDYYSVLFSNNCRVSGGNCAQTLKDNLLFREQLKTATVKASMALICTSPSRITQKSNRVAPVVFVNDYGKVVDFCSTNSQGDVLHIKRLNFKESFGFQTSTERIWTVRDVWPQKGFCGGPVTAGPLAIRDLSKAKTAKFPVTVMNNLCLRNDI